MFIACFFVLSLSNALPFEKFENWITEFKINHDSEGHLYSLFKKWYDNDKYIESINSQDLNYKLGHNQYSGMNTEEFSNFVSYSKDIAFERREPNYLYGAGYFNSTLPVSVDWVALGGVTPVKDQGQCGSCWSFSTTGALEGAYFVTNDKLLSFSEEQLVDCDNLKNGGRNHGCNGGIMDSAFNWINKNDGLCLEMDYSYVSQNGPVNQECKTTCIEVSGSKITDYFDIPVSSDNSMMGAIAKQPVSIAIEADERDFQLYSSGVFTGKCGTSLDHGVLAVGYGTLAGLDYYLVKNSWGTSWGESGYIKLGRGSQYNNGSGQCGMLLEGSYPIL